MVDGGEEVFGKVGDEGGDGLEVTFGVARGEAAEEVAVVCGRLILAGWRCLKRGGREIMGWCFWIVEACASLKILGVSRETSTYRALSNCVSAIVAVVGVGGVGYQGRRPLRDLQTAEGLGFVHRFWVRSIKDIDENFPRSTREE